MTSHKISLTLVAVILLVGGMPLASAVDTITRRSDNAKIRGQILRSDNTQLVIKRANGEEDPISVANIKSVVFDQEPSALGQARSNENSGALDTALTKFREIDSGYSGTNKFLKADLKFLIARVLGKQALIDPAKADEAIKAIEEFRTTQKDSFRYFEATLLQASLHSIKQETEKGKALLSEVQGSPVKGFQLQAGVDLGRLLLAAGDAAGAQAAFQDVVAKSQGDESATAALYDGMLGLAMGLKQENKPDEAIKALDEVIAKAPDSETRTLAEAWLRKGDCLKQKNEAKASLMAYLHVDVLYAGEPAQHAEALKRLSEMWVPAGHEDRAVDASARLAEKYPNSQWAKQ